MNGLISLSIADSGRASLTGKNRAISTGAFFKAIKDLGGKW
jgi:hypothetical protein